MSLRDKLTDEEWETLEAFGLVDKPKITDPIVEAVVDMFTERSRVGIAKYGTTLQENDLTIHEWLQHLQEELMDATLYIQKMKEEIK